MSAALTATSTSCVGGGDSGSSRPRSSCAPLRGKCRDARAEGPRGQENENTALVVLVWLRAERASFGDLYHATDSFDATGMRRWKPLVYSNSDPDQGSRRQPSQLVPFTFRRELAASQHVLVLQVPFMMRRNPR